jgi:hypothetical protein
MAYEYESIIKAQYETIAQQRAQAAADLEAARLSEDSYSTMDSAARIVDADVRRAAVDQIANRFVASQQQAPQGNPHNLSNDEMDIAKGSHLTPEQYARNKQRYQAMKSQGYWDQGRVFK